MGGVCFFNLAVDTPNGDMALLEKVGRRGSWKRGGLALAWLGGTSPLSAVLRGIRKACAASASIWHSMSCILCGTIPVPSAPRPPPRPAPAPHSPLPFICLSFCFLAHR